MKRKNISLILIFIIACMSCSMDQDEQKDKDKEKDQEQAPVPVAVTKDKVPILPQFGFTATISKSARVVSTPEMSKDEFLYWLEVPCLSGFDVTNAGEITVDQAFTQTFLGLTVTTTCTTTKENEYVYTSVFDNGKIVITYHKDTNTFDYLEELMIHDTVGTLNGPTGCDVHAAALYQLQNATIDPTTGYFQGTGRSAIYMKNDNYKDPEKKDKQSFGVQIMKYEAYCGGLSDATDIGTGIYTTRISIGGIIDIADFDETTLPTDFSTALSGFTPYLEKIVNDPVAFDSLPQLTWGGSITYHRKSTNEFVSLQDETDYSANGYIPTASGTTSFLNDNLPAYWKSQKKLAFPE